MKPVFCFSAGRSGSTLLLRILNAHDEFSISGEHKGFLNPLVHNIVELAEGKPSEHMRTGYERTQVDGQQFNPWRQNHPPEHFIAATADYLRACFQEDDKVWGFKETRYKAPEVEAFQKILPDANYLLLARDPLHQTTSAMFAFFRDVPETEHEALELIDWRLENWIKTYRGYQPLFEDHITAIYDDLVSSKDAIDRMFSQLGYGPPSPDALAPVLEEKLGSSYAPRAEARERRADLEALIMDKSAFYPEASTLFDEMRERSLLIDSGV